MQHLRQESVRDSQKGLWVSMPYSATDDIAFGAEIPKAGLQATSQHAAMAGHELGRLLIMEKDARYCDTSFQRQTSAQLMTSHVPARTNQPQPAQVGILLTCCKAQKQTSTAVGQISKCRTRWAGLKCKIQVEVTIVG